MDILVFGAGDMTARYLTEAAGLNIVVKAFLDNDTSLYNHKLYGIAPVVAPNKHSFFQYEKIIVASSVNNEIRNMITEQLLSLGVSLAKIVYYPIKTGVDYHPRMLFFRSFAKLLKNRGLPGDIAECGVWTGETAKYINRYFSDRTLWLFDTFEGYPEESLTEERTLKTFSENTLGIVQKTQTSIELVMSKMTFPENVIVRKGYFPGTAINLAESYCLVHIDMTLYKPTINALNVFWERLSPQGIIVVRDYFSPVLPGAKKAVDDFEKKLGYTIPKAPLGDTSCITLIKG